MAKHTADSVPVDVAEEPTAEEPAAEEPATEYVPQHLTEALVKLALEDREARDLLLHAMRVTNVWLGAVPVELKEQVTELVERVGANKAAVRVVMMLQGTEPVSADELQAALEELNKACKYSPSAIAAALIRNR